MYALDFEYDGKYLSDYGFIICDFDSSTGAQIMDNGANITFNTVSQHSGKRYGLTSTQYDDCIQATFDICKNPDIYEYKFMEITAEEYRHIVRWLNRHEFLKLRFFDNDKELEPCYYEASFNINKIKIGEIVYGIELEMVTNRPFGFGAEIHKVYDFQNAEQTYTLTDTSDEIGYIYPSLVITCSQEGNLYVNNDVTNCKMYIRNCSQGEVITIDGKTHSITSSVVEHDICNDFNYDYFKIGNTFDNKRNKISVSLPCKIDLRYSPIIKISP